MTRGPRLTFNKIAKAINALRDLQACVDLPSDVAGDYGDVKEHIERLLVDDIHPLVQLLPEDDR